MIIKNVYDYFSGGKVVQIQKDGYEEPVMIPKADSAIIDLAIQDAVKRGLLWLVYGSASIYAQEVPAGLIGFEAILLPVPAKLSTMDVLPDRLPEAWKSDTSTAMAISAALSSKYGKPLPWKIIQAALDGAFQAHYLERTIDSKPWPCDFGGAQWIKVRIPHDVTPPPAPGGTTGGYVVPTPDSKRIAETEMQPNQLQDMADIMGQLLSAAGEYDLKFFLRIEVDAKAPQEVVEKLNQLLDEVNGKIVLK